MAKAPLKMRETRDSLRQQVHNVVATATRMKKRMAGQPVKTDFSHLFKLKANASEDAAQIKKKYKETPDPNDVTDPEVLAHIQSMAQQVTELKDTLSKVKEDLANTRKYHG